MKYITTDYRYEWDETHDMEFYLTEEGIEYWVLFPKDKSETKKLAISMQLLNAMHGIWHNEIEYDVFALESESELKEIEKFVSKHLFTKIIDQLKSAVVTACINNRAKGKKT